jgi:chloride channel 7
MYKKELEKKEISHDKLKLLMFGVMGVVIGGVAFLIEQTSEFLAVAAAACLSFLIARLQEFRVGPTRELLAEGDFAVAFLRGMAYTAVTVGLAAGICVFWSPAAAGSGVPEVMGFLNGVHVRRIFRVKTMVAKFISTVLAVASGMAVSFLSG